MYTLNLCAIYLPASDRLLRDEKHHYECQTRAQRTHKLCTHLHALATSSNVLSLAHEANKLNHTNWATLSEHIPLSSKTSACTTMPIVEKPQPRVDLNTLVPRSGMHLRIALPLNASNLDQVVVFFFFCVYVAAVSSVQISRHRNTAAASCC